MYCTLCLFFFNCSYQGCTFLHACTFRALYIDFLAIFLSNCSFQGGAFLHGCTFLVFFIVLWAYFFLKLFISRACFSSRVYLSCSLYCTLALFFLIVHFEGVLFFKGALFVFFVLYFVLVFYNCSFQVGTLLHECTFRALYIFFWPCLVLIAHFKGVLFSMGVLVVFFVLLFAHDYFYLFISRVCFSSWV